MEQTKRTWKETGAGWSKPVDGIWIENPVARGGMKGVSFYLLIFFFCELRLDF